MKTTQPQTASPLTTSHTPRPWLIAQDRGPIYITHAGSLGKVATIADNSRDQRIACANARLIAAAPDMLLALEAVLRNSETYNTPEGREALAKAFKALARAKG